MSIGQRLRAYIEKSGRKQTDVAMSWLEGWRKQSQGEKDWKEDTIVSQLNRCLNDAPQGVRFFFGDRERGALLLDMLSIPTEERSSLFELASQGMSIEASHPQVIIDATGWPGAAPHTLKLFDAIEQQVVMAGPFPMVLLILEDQFRYLPRSLDEYKDKDQLRFEKVKTQEEGWARVQHLAEEQGLVISRRRFHDFERWLAADFSGTRLLFDPSDGLAQYLSAGRLPPLPEVTHELSVLVPPGSEIYQALPDSPLLQRMLMAQLRSEADAAKLNIPAHVRQFLARSLGITATSTARERLEAELATFIQGLPLPVTTAESKHLEELRARATRRGLDPTAVRVGDVVHLLNMDEEVASRAKQHAWVQVEHITHRPTPLARLLEAVHDWTEDDYLSDPLLEQLIERLDPAEEERKLFLHARMSLLRNQALAPKPATLVEDWQPALRELLSANPPEALIRVGTNGGRLMPRGGAPRLFALPGGFANLTKQTPGFYQFPPVGEVLVPRGQQVVVVQPIDEGNISWRDRQYADLYIADGVETARDIDLWLDLSDELMGRQQGSERVWEKHSGRVQRVRTDLWRTTTLDPGEQSWSDADRELALAWMALRRATEDATWISLPNQSVLLQVTPGIFAELYVTQRPQPVPDAPIQASLLRPLSVEDAYPQVTFRLQEIRTTTPTHGVAGTRYEFGPSLLREIHLRGGRFNARIRFHGSALFEIASPRMPAVAAAVMKEHDDDSADDARRRADEDDDD